MPGSSKSSRKRTTPSVKTPRSSVTNGKRPSACLRCVKKSCPGASTNWPSRADVAPAGLTILAEEARPVADFNRTEIEALIASGMTALEAAKTAEEQDRLQNEIDQWKNLLLDASIGRETAH